MKDYYKILGVREEASEEEIRACWIELTKRYHPDLEKTEEGEEKIREVNEAYETLRDEAARFQYDFERDLKRAFVKKAHHREQERRINVRKMILIPSSGILVLFLIASFFIFRSGRVSTPRKTEALQKSDKRPVERIASQTPSPKTDSKAQKRSGAAEVAPEAARPSKTGKEGVPPERKEMASLSPRSSPSVLEREPEQKRESPRIILPELSVPAVAKTEPFAEKKLESKEKPAAQAMVKSERPATKEVSKEIPRETPKQVVGEAAREAPRERIREVPKEVSKDTPKEIPKPVVKESPKEVVKEAPKEIVREVPKEVAVALPREVSKEALKDVPKEAPKETPKQAAGEISKDAPKEIPKPVVKESPKEVVKEAPGEVPKPAVKEAQREAPKGSPTVVVREVAKELPKESPKETPKDATRVVFHPGESLTMWTKGEPVASYRSSPLAREDEVRQFFKDYVNRYHEKDATGLLSFFSTKAVQNQTEGFEAIRSIYTKWIDQSEELRYRIEGMKIEIYQQSVEVKARFRVDQKLKKDGAEKAWKGNIRWVLVKEGGRLKIRSLDYQNEKSP